MTRTSLLSIALLSLAGMVHGQESEFEPRFYAFQNGVAFGSVARNAQVLAELGYDGISQVRDAKLAEQVEEFEKAGLEVLSVYLDVEGEPLQTAQLQPLANRGAMVELTIRNMTPTTVEAVRATAEMAAGLEIRVALYPHAGFSVATMPQAIELIEKVNHPNLGVMFNLCHFLKSEKAEDLEATLEKAGDRLFAVSTSGADLGGKDWSQLIQTLDRGDFPQERLLRALKKMGFRGPVGLQCYAIKGDRRGNLERSIMAWKKALERI